MLPTACRRAEPMPRHVYFLRVFVRDPARGSGGNPLAVVPDTVEVLPETMQRVAAELALSETAFLQWERGKPPHVRIFTPAIELPFAGHPLVGTAWLINTLGPGGGTDCLTCGAGEVSTWREGDTVWIGTALPPVQPARHRISGVLDALGLEAPALTADPAEAGHNRLLVLRTDAAWRVRELLPDFTRLAQEPAAANGVYVVAPDSTESTFRARFFSPGHGIDEDPATGSAAIALAAVLVAETQATGAATIHQGDEVGSPSSLLLRWDETGASLGGGVVKDRVDVISL